MLSLTFVLSSLLLLGVAGSPNRFSIRSLRQRPPVHDPEALRIFDANFANRELRSVLSKYAMADQFLKGIGLSPEQTIPFVQEFVTFEDPTQVSSTNETTPARKEKTADTFESGPLLAPVSITPGVAKMPLRDFMSGTLDLAYYGPMKFGTPPQELTVDIDTGSADLWVPASCRNCNSKQFKPSASSTYRDQHKKFAVAYGSGDVSGKLATDAVAVGGLTVKTQALGAVNSESEEFRDYPHSGLLGLAFGSIASSGKPTFFENLMTEKKVATPFFSIHLARNQEKGSEVCFGCFDTMKTKGPVSWIPVLSKTYWAVPMESIKLNSAPTLEVNIVAAIDTGTTLIYVPETVAQSFYGKIPGARPFSRYGPGFFTYPCASKLVIAFSLGGKDFSIDPFDFNLGRTDVGSKDCVGGILSLGNGFPADLAIIGDEFLKSWYSVYDYSNGARVGLAPSVNNH